MLGIDRQLNRGHMEKFWNPVGRMGTGSRARSPSYRCEPSHSGEEQGSSECGKPPRRGTSWWPCSSESTYHGGNHPASRTEGTGTGNLSSKESSRSRRGCRKSRVRSSCAAHGWSPHASHQHGTRRAARYRRECAKSPAARRKRGDHSEAGSFLCRFRHREGNRPINMQD